MFLCSPVLSTVNDNKVDSHSLGSFWRWNCYPYKYKWQQLLLSSVTVYRNCCIKAMIPFFSIYLSGWISKYDIMMLIMIITVVETEPRISHMPSCAPTSVNINDLWKWKSLIWRNDRNIIVTSLLQKQRGRGYKYSSVVEHFPKVQRPWVPWVASAEQERWELR